MTPDRSSEADEPVLVSDAQEIARIEAENTLRQFDAAMKELTVWISTSNYRLKPSTLLRFNRIALNKLSKYAGVFRPGDIKISGSRHKPIEASLVPEAVEDFCEYVNDNWHAKSAIHLAAYALWRLNWIHPFVDGNGRTSRIVSYLIICAKLGYRLPGINTIPEQIAANKGQYYSALESADHALEDSRMIDVSQLEAIIDAYLATQLLGVHDRAAGVDINRNAVATIPDAGGSIDVGRQRFLWKSLIKTIEAHPVLTGGVITLVVAVLTIIFA